MKLRNVIVFAVFVIATALGVSSCKGSGGSGGGGASDTQATLNQGNAVTGPSNTDCSNSFVFEAVNTLCELFGSGSCISQQSSCNSYERELYTGCLLSKTGTYWNGRGGSGEPMADASLCIMRELSPKVPGGGPLTSTASIDLGIGTMKIEQEVGYLDFDRVNARFTGYRKMYVELPVLGKFDAVTQNIDLQKTVVGAHGFNPYPFAGNVQILHGYGLDLITEEKTKTLSITPPAFDVPTPIGVFSAQPDFQYQSYTTVADSPYAADHTYIILPPDNYGDVAIDLSDLYGIQPGVANDAQIVPSLGAYKLYRNGWISQIGMGNRGTGTGSETVWSPPASGVFSRPDYDPFNKLDFLSYVPRSDKENQPSIHAKAAAHLKYPKDPKALLPSWVNSLNIADVEAYIQVSPTIEAGAAGQFGIALSEGTNYYRDKEFGLKSDRTAALGIYEGVKANASFYIDTLLRIKVDANFDLLVGTVTLNLIDISPHFPIPLAGGTPVGSGVKFASAYSLSTDSNLIFPVGLDSLNAFTGTKADPAAFITQCYAKENEVPPEQPPTPTSSKGDPADLFKPEVWPCNICIATDEVRDTDGTLKEPAHADFLMPAQTLPTTWKCDGRIKSGCMDKCTWDKTFDASGKPNLVVVAGPGEIADGIPASDPQHAFFKSCLQPCSSYPSIAASSACLKGLPQIASVNTDTAAPFPIDGNITATFTEAMDPGTFTTADFLISLGTRTVTGTVSYDPSTFTAIFDPANNLDSNTTYTATITTGVTDEEGNHLASDVVWSFTTGI
jgi:hypothetical protein